MKLFPAFLLLFLYLGASAQVVSPFTGLPVKCDTASSYSFLVSGHFYGSSSSRSEFPASTIIAATDKLNSADPAFMVCLGDLFPSLKEEVLRNYEYALFSRLEFPLLNVPGNHDLMSGNYQEKFGKSWSSFSCENGKFILLDSEQDNGDISGDQLEMLGNSLSQVAPGEPVFIFTHRTLWRDGIPALKNLFPDNTRSMLEGNFRDDVLPLLNKVAETNPVYWFAGSMGNAPASFFYHKEGKMHFIATAIRDLPRDALLKVNVNNGNVNFETISLTAGKVKELSEYNLGFYESARGETEPFNYRLLPYLAKQTITSAAFWWGFGAALIVFLLFLFFIKRRRRYES